jgi:hypothetical protein
MEKRGWHWALTSFTFEVWGGVKNTDLLLLSKIQFLNLIKIKSNIV